MVLLGRILKLKGNKGEVVVEASPASVKYFPLQEGEYILESKKYHKKLNLQFCKEFGSNYLIRFESINSITEAYRLVGYSVLSEDVPETVSQEESVLGYEVIDINTSEVWGDIADVISGNMSELLELSDGTLIPVCEEIVVEVDCSKNKVYIDPPEGLRDINN